MSQSVIFFFPISKGLRELKTHMEEDETVEIYEMDNPAELVQIVATLRMALILTSDTKKCARFLSDQKKLIKSTGSKVVLLSNKEIPPKTFDKLRQWGLTDAIIEPIPAKSLIYKVYLLLKSLIDDVSKGAEKVTQNIKDNIKAEKIDTQSKARIEKLTVENESDKFQIKNHRAKSTGIIFSNAPDDSNDKENDSNPQIENKQQGPLAKKSTKPLEVTDLSKKENKKNRETSADKNDSSFVKDIQNQLQFEKQQDQEKKKRGTLEFENESNHKEDTIDELQPETTEQKKKRALQGIEIEKTKRKSINEQLIFEDTANDKAEMSETAEDKKEHSNKLEKIMSLDLEEKNKEKKQEELELLIKKKNAKTAYRNIQFEDENQLQKDESLDIKKVDKKTKSALGEMTFEAEESEKTKKAHLDIEDQNKKIKKSGDDIQFEKLKKKKKTTKDMEFEKTKNKSKDGHGELLIEKDHNKQSEHHPFLQIEKENGDKKNANQLDFDDIARAKKKKNEQLFASIDKNENDDFQNLQDELNDEDNTKNKKQNILEIEKQKKDKNIEHSPLFEKEDENKEEKTKEQNSTDENEVVAKQGHELEMERVGKKKEDKLKPLIIEQTKSKIIEKDKERDSSWDDISLKRSKDEITEDDNNQKEQGITIDYTKEKKSYEENTIDYSQFKKKVWGEETSKKGIEIGELTEEENEIKEVKKEKVIEIVPDIIGYTGGIEHSVKILVLYQENSNNQDKKDIESQIFTAIAKSVYKEKGGLVKFYSNVTGQIEKLHPINQDSSNPPSEVFTTKLPKWSDPTFQNNEMEFIYPFYEGDRSLGVAICNFTGSIKNEKDCLLIESILENARGIFLAKFHQAGEEGTYTKKSSSQTKKAESGIFSKLFKKKK